MIPYHCTFKGVKLPDYITKLLQITGYGNLQSLSKLNSTSLIQELEQYTTNNLDPSDLELKEHEERFFFNQKTNKFSILPGHKHLIINAAETVQKVMQHAQEDYAREQQQAEDNDQDLCVDASEDIKSNTRVRPLQHFLADLNSSSSSSNGRVSGKKRDSIKMSDTPAASPTVEQEQQSLAEYVAIWLSRKLASGQLDPFILDVDYRINVIRPRNCASQPFRPDIYSFVCLRCKTTIKAFKRPNGLSWNATNVSFIVMRSLWNVSRGDIAHLL